MNNHFLGINGLLRRSLQNADAKSAMREMETAGPKSRCGLSIFPGFCHPAEPFLHRAPRCHRLARVRLLHRLEDRGEVIRHAVPSYGFCGRSDGDRRDRGSGAFRRRFTERGTTTQNPRAG